MSRKSHKKGKGIVSVFLMVLALIFAFGFTGCANGTASAVLGDGDTGDDEKKPGGLGNGNGNEQKVPPETAKENADALLGILNAAATSAGITETLFKIDENNNNIVVQEANAVTLEPTGGRTALPIDTFPVGAGVTLRIPEGKTLEVLPTVKVTVANQATLEVKGVSAENQGKVILAGTLTNSGTVAVLAHGVIENRGTVTVANNAVVTIAPNSEVKVESGATVVVSGGRVEVQSASGERDSGGKITVASNGTIDVKSNGTLETTAASSSGNTSAQIVVEKGGEIAAAGTVTVAANSTVEVKAGGKVEVASTGKVTTGANTEVKIEETGGLTVVGSGSVTVSDTKKVDTSNITGGENAVKIEDDTEVPPRILSTALSYESKKAKIVFTFDTAFTDDPDLVDDPTGWSISKEEAVVTATYTGDTAAKQTIKFTDGESGETEYSATVYTQAESALPTDDGHAFVSYEKDGDNTIIGLKKSDTTTYYYLASVPAYFEAIYTPNAPGSQDTIEDDKKTITYTEAISNAVLGLFTINFNSNTIHLTGTDLSAITATGADANNLIIIDIGKPGADNSALPKFYIPLNGEANGSAKGTLGNGEDTTGYAHIRLRVNNGAELVIKADNSGGLLSSCPVGGFTGGAVEVMSGGKLRDGALQGFPLGAGAVLINRYGSYMAIGPEDNHNNADSWWGGYLVGPALGEPRILWTGGPGDFLEVREGKLAFSGKAKIQKTMGLIYSAWFIGNSEITIDIPDTYTNKLFGYNGLFANDGEDAQYDFYATDNRTRITLLNGVIHKAFLTGEAQDAGIVLKKKDNVSDAIIFSSGSGGTSKEYPDSDSEAKFTGYQNWDFTDTNLEAENIGG